MVQVGVDHDRDRELETDDPVKLLADRQVDYYIKAVQPSGTVQVKTLADDFKVPEALVIQQRGLLWAAR